MDIIKTIDLTKKFGSFTANHNINLSVREGEIKAIVGENGAGKSTLMNMLYGLLKPTSGEIYLRGRLIHFHSPEDAINQGIGMVHQHFKLVPSLTVFENVLLGVEIHKTVNIKGKEIQTFKIDHKTEKIKVEELIHKYHFNINASDKVKDLSIGAKQKVEILKMLYRNVNILIFDEPTAVLTPQEIEIFYQTLRDLKAVGTSIILITHKLQEVMDISDSVTVIKKGEVVKHLETKNTNQKELAQLMVGRDVLLRVNKKYKDYNHQPVLYECKSLTTLNKDGRAVVNDVSFQIRKGEIVGIAGVEGNGQSELIDVMSGLLKATAGHILLDGKDITNIWPSDLRKKHVAFIPEDRYEQGLCKDMSIKDNMIAGYHQDHSTTTFGLISEKKAMEKTSHLIQDYDIRVSDHEGLISSLSGGNAQKVIIAREFNSNPELLIAAQPTRGVDIGAIEFIHQSLLDLQNKGKSILLISSELSEILNLSDRILVMYKGKIIGELDAKHATAEKVGYLMMGIKDEDNNYGKA